MEKTAIIYARVSTSRQADNELPIESQIEQCQAKASELGATVVKVFRDDGVSGTKAGRRGWQAALLYCETHSTDYFVCWDTKRFARNHQDAVMNKVFLRRIGTQLVYASQSFEGEDGWLMEGMFQLFDEHYSRRVGRDTMRSMAKNASDGFWNGGHVPFGFKTVPVGKRKRLEPIQDEAAVVRNIYRWCLQGSGCKAIAERLNESGTSIRGKKWSKARVSNVLQACVNVGQLSFTVADETITTNAHDQIISMEDFLMAQDMIKERAPQNVGGRPRSLAVFAGLLRCGHCGEALTTETATGRSARYHYYNCRSFLKGMGCKSSRIPVDGVDEFLLGSIMDKIFTHENIIGMVRDVKTSTSKWTRDHDAQVEAVHTQLQAVSSKLENLYSAVEAGSGLDISDLGQRIRERKAEKNKLEAQLIELERTEAPAAIISEDELEQAARLFRDLVQTCEDPRRLRGFLGTFVRRVVILGTEASIEYWPERIVNAQLGGSQCEVRWLPDLSTLRTVRVKLPINKAA